MVLEGEAYRSWLGCEGEGLMNGISALIEDHREPFPTNKDSTKSLPLDETLIVDFQPPELGEIKVCCL